jgi:CubicO group peptidase (beta-lactamase class C family)
MRLHQHPRYVHLAPLLAALAATGLAGCIADPDLKLANEHAPVARNDGWEISTPEREGIDSVAFEEVYRRFFDPERFHTAISLLVIRNGRLIGEGYCHDRRDIDIKRNIKSCTKSFTSLLAGIAIDKGLLGDLDTPVARYLPEYFDDPAKRPITLYQALTMQTGLAYDNDADNDELMGDPPESSLRYMLRQPLAFAPGERFHYSDAPPHLVGAVVGRVAGMPLDSFAARELFEPLGITDYLWEKHRDGLCYGAFGLYLKPRDLAKVGQLCLQDGMWNGKQIVSREWLERSTSIHVNRNDGPYGLYWWVRPDFGAYMMAGHGGNYVYVIPEKGIVVVLTAMPFVDESIAIPIYDVEDLITLLVAAAR